MQWVNAGQHGQVLLMERTLPFSTGPSGYPEKTLINHCINGSSKSVEWGIWHGVHRYLPLHSGQGVRHYFL